MSETTVSFLTEVMSGTQATYPVSVRVFSTEISQTSANIYGDAIETLDYAMNGEYWDSTSKSWVSDPSRDPSSTIQSIMQFLDVWSQMKTVTNGQEGYSSGSVDGLSVTSTLDSSTNQYVYTINGLNAANLGSVGDAASSGSVALTSTMNRYMGESVDQIVRTLRAAGWDPVGFNGAGIGIGDPTTALNNIAQDTSGIYNFGTVLQNAYNVLSTALIIGNAYSQSDSIQQILMTDYVIAGNAMLFTEMSSLQDAINTNQTCLNYLNSLQDLMNQKTPEDFIMQLQNLASNNPQYQQFESSTFNQTLTNIPNFTSADVSNYVALVSSGVLTTSYPLDSTFVSDASKADPTKDIFYAATQYPAQVTESDLATLKGFPTENYSSSTVFVGDPNDTTSGHVFVSGLNPTSYVANADLSTLTNLKIGYPPDSQFTSDATQADPSKHIYYVQGLSAGAFVSLSDLQSSGVTTVFGTTIDQVISNLTYLQNQLSSTGADGTPLSQQIGVVLNDFQALKTSGGSLETWVADFDTSNQGTYQTHLNNAVVASQSLNDTEREKLQEVMFVYQEFYQSASSMLSDIHQLLQTMAQNAGR